MKLAVFICVSLIFLSACAANDVAPFDAAKTPEDRKEYYGVKGMEQYQKDKVHLLNAELVQKCTDARVALAVAETENHAEEVTLQRDIIEKTCRSS